MNVRTTIGPLMALRSDSSRAAAGGGFPITVIIGMLIFVKYWVKNNYDNVVSFNLRATVYGIGV